MGAVINSNYWRIEGIKNVYEVFQKEITDKFDKDLSEYKLEEIEDIVEENEEEIDFIDKEDIELKYELDKYYENSKENNNDCGYDSRNVNNNDYPNNIDNNIIDNNSFCSIRI